jgi:hypothetical protein
MIANKVLKYLLVTLLAIVVIPLDLYCIFFLVFGIVLGKGIQYRADTPEYFWLLIMPWVIASFSTALSWLALRLWTVPNWRFASFPIALSLYAVAAGVMRTVGLF